MDALLSRGNCGISVAKARTVLRKVFLYRMIRRVALLPSAVVCVDRLLFRDSNPAIRAVSEPAQHFLAVIEHFRTAEIRAKSAALAFEVILGEPDFFTHLMLETTPEQRFEQPSHER